MTRAGPPLRITSLRAFSMTDSTWIGALGLTSAPSVESKGGGVVSALPKIKHNDTQ